MMSLTIKFLIIFLSVHLTLCENQEYYVSPSGSSENSGTKESPWNFSWSSVSSKLRTLFTNSNREDTYTIHFLEGDYYVDEYGITLSKM